MAEPTLEELCITVNSLCNTMYKHYRYIQELQNEIIALKKEITSLRDARPYLWDHHINIRKGRA